MVTAVVLIKAETGTVPGITKPETLIAFKVHSKQDIEAAFSPGLD